MIFERDLNNKKKIMFTHVVLFWCSSLLFAGPDIIFHHFLLACRIALNISCSVELQLINSFHFSCLIKSLLHF